MNHKSFLFISIIIMFSAFGCKKSDEATIKPTITLKNSSDYTQNEQLVSVGGKLKFGIIAKSVGSIITNLKIQRVSDGSVITEMDKGIYQKDSLTMEFSPTKSSATLEEWRFFMMNSNRDSAITTITVNLGAGTSYSEIYHYPSIKIGMQDNSTLPNYLDPHDGNLYTKANIAGHEGVIDILGFVYTTSGILSPTLCCPGYTGSSSVTGKYPEIELWGIKNLTSYDYYTSDNNLVNPSEFDNAQNDSLLVNSFKPEKVSGLCKYCNTGKIIPFKTEDGKYGLIRVLHADLTETGYMELEVKIQK